MKLRLAYTLTMGVLLLGCDKLCHKNVQDVADIQNGTGRELTATFCKGRMLGAQQITIPADQSGPVVLGQREESYVVGGPGARCNQPGGETVHVGLSLDAETFQYLKLCYLDESGSKILLLNPDQPCPEGSREQTTFMGDCSSPAAPSGGS